MLEEITNVRLHEDSQVAREGAINSVSQFSFVIGDEKYSPKYMCFDNKNSDS